MASRGDSPLTRLNHTQLKLRCCAGWLEAGQRRDQKQSHHPMDRLCCYTAVPRLGCNKNPILY
jgi:hypothetical protein